MTKTAIITGATSGFGQSCAEKFAQDGYRLVIVGRRKERLDALANELSKTTEVHTIILDVRERQSVFDSFYELPEGFNEPDILVNNAGLALGLEPAHQANLDDWETMIDTNCKGLMYCTRALLPGMVERKRGHIINVGSMAGNWPYPGGNCYGASKAFVQQFSRNLRSDVHGTGVKITNIEPGFSKTEFSLVRFKGDEDRADSLYEQTEHLTPNDIADMILWVANTPAHVNVNTLEVMPTCQSWSPLSIHKKES